MVTPVVVLAVCVGVVVVVAAVLTVACRRYRSGELPPEPRFEHDRSRRGPWPRRTPGPVARCRPVQEVAADLRRLSRQLARVPAGAPFVRWQALQSAYDRVLVEAAEQLEVPHALDDFPVGGARDVERLRVVCALEAAGLAVQD